MKPSQIVALAAAMVLAVMFGAVAFGQDGLLAGLIQPLVVNIEQQVPVDVTLAVPLEDGSMVTTTAPITVGIALQVKIDGVGVVSVEAGEADTPAVTTEMAEEAEEAKAGNDLVDLVGIPYTVDSASDLAITQIRAKESFGKIQLVGELRNDGEDTTVYVLLTAKFYDADGALLDVGSGVASTQAIKPGGSSSFTVISTVPFEDVASYAVEIQ